jgi:hypothetical protein
MTDSAPKPKRRPPTRWADAKAGSNACEERPWTCSGVTPRMGRSSIAIRCPFCNWLTTAFLWSLSGGGKRCENRACGALFGSSGTAYRLVAEAVDA